MEFEDTIYVVRLGTQAGYRIYPSGRNQGLYLQGAVSSYYVSGQRPGLTKGTGYWLDGLGYIGYAAKYGNLGIQADVGAGYSIAIRSGSSSQASSMTKPGFLGDVNLALGYYF